MSKFIGNVSAYAYAVSKGYTGMEEEFAELMADYAEVGQSAEDAAESALNSKTAAQTAATTATNKAGEATTAAQTATTKADEASTSASTAISAKDTAVSASQTATTKATEATTAAATATSAATTATTAKDDAVSAKTAAQTAQTGAETAAASVQSSAAQITTNAEDITQLKEDLNDLNSAVFEEITSINRFDPSLVTSESVTADKRLYGNGTLKDATGIDVTPFLPILPNTEYSMGLVPKYGSAGIPWYGTSICVEFYSAASETSQISRINRTTNEPITFTSPDNANFYRFNIARSSGITLAILSSRFMVVVGSSLPDTFSPYGDTKQSKIDILNSAVNDLSSIHYKIKNDILTVTSGYGTASIVVEFGKRGPNNLPDFKTITAEGRNKFNNQTDWFGPFLMSAVNNADGDDITGRTYTGGNHNYMNTGSMDSTATGRNISLHYYVNGKEIVGDVEGDTNRIEIAWVNRIQAYNTKKADGTGREVLEERHKMIYDGRQWEVFTEVEALEAIFCDSYYGMQCYVKNYGTIQMIGANYRLPFPYTTPHDSGNNAPNTYIAFDTNDRLEMEVDRSYDMGKGTMYGASGTQGFRTASTKGYTYFISQKNMEANATYGAHGWYRFMPQY